MAKTIPQDPKDRRQAGEQSPEAWLLERIKAWDKIRGELAEARKELDDLQDMDAPSNMTGGVESEIRRLERARKDQAERIAAYVEDHPNMRKTAVQAGFPSRLLKGGTQESDPDRQPSEGDRFGGGGEVDSDQPLDAVDQLAGSQGNDPTRGGRGTGGRGGGGAGGAGPRPDLRGQAADNRLLGDKGKHYVIRRGPEGAYLAVYSFKVEGQIIKIAVQIPRKDLARYGIKEGEGKELTRAQMRNIENLGFADQLAPYVRKGDGHMVKALERYLANQYGGNPMLKNDEVMGKVIANSLFGWTPGEFENQLRNTKWYENTNEHQRIWDTTMSDKERIDIVNSTLQQVINALENTYGFEYLKHIDGGMKQIKTWADQIASGRWGTPDQGLAFWSEKQFDKAVGIEGTPAWVSRQKQEEANRLYLNRPEDRFEELRAQAEAYLGPRHRPDKATLMAWATDLVTENKSDHDWAQFLRNQSKALHPWKDPDTPWQDFASSYRSQLEETIGRPVDWSHKLLADLQAFKPDGTALNQPLSAHDFGMKIRDPNLNPEAYEAGTPLYKDGMDRLHDILGRLRGAA